MRARAGRGLGLVGLAAAAVAAAACASPGVPPGGPERRTPPRLVRVAPESGAVGARPREVVFEYDAVVSETPRGGASSAGAGASGLAALVVVSPRSGAVAVDWRRERIAVRPRRGFRPNVTYTVTVLPGIQDLRNNVRDSAAVAVFSTGGPIARGALRGVVFDWANGRAAASAVVEATGADSATYFAVADSAGRFVVPNVPPGPYLVRGTVDLNVNRTADPREAFDTVRAVAATAPVRTAAPADTAGVAVYAFARDSAPPALTNIVAGDSVTLRLTFARPLRPDQPFAGRVRVVRADSAVLAVRSVLTPAVADSITQAEARAAAQRAAPADSAARPARADSAPAPGAQRSPFARDAERAAGPGGGAPRLGRPVPPTELVVRLAAPLPPNTTVRVRVADLRSLAGVAGTVERTFTAPRAPRAGAVPAAAAPAAPAVPAPTTAPPATPAAPPPARPASPAAPPPPARRP